MIPDTAMIFLIPAVIYLGHVRILTLLTYFQQEGYDPWRYMRSLLRVRLFDVQASLALCALALIDGIWSISIFPTFLCAAVILWIAARESRYVYKKPLVYTERARRILWLSRIQGIVCLAFSGTEPLFLILSIQTLPFLLTSANWYFSFFQKQVDNRYIQEASKKLESFNPVRIGITGSFGKTTVKHILAEILPLSGAVFYSRGSINTKLGLTRHIRERLQRAHRYFIAEMGAYGIGSINTLCSFICPSYGIVTAVGDSHTERFGGIENTAKAKAELVSYVCSKGGHIVLNADVLQFDIFKQLKSLYGSQITVVGFDKKSDIRIEKAESRDGLWTIVLQGQGEEKLHLTYQIPLLGFHNVMNSALAVVMVYKLDPEVINRIPALIKDVEQIPHRLQKRESRGQPLVLDDSFNANKSGFENAIMVASQLAEERGGRVFLVTPGIVELGSLHDTVHYALGLFCKGKCDKVYVVNPSRVPTFIAGLGAASVEHIGVSSFSAARRHLSESEVADEKDIILYENDLLDLLEEKRFL